MKISHNPTAMIKSKFSNQVHRLLEQNIDVKKSERWRIPIKKLTDAEKLELFEKIVKVHKECSSELTSYFTDRRQKNKVKRARIVNGVKPKEKTKLIN